MKKKTSTGAGKVLRGFKEAVREHPVVARRNLPREANRYRRWTAAEIALLGSKPDFVLARKLGRSICSIQLQRKIWGVPGPQRPIRHWTKAEDALLGTATDQEIARRIDRSVLAVRIRRRETGIRVRRADGQRPWEDFELDVVRLFSDEESARILGRSLAAIISKRSKMRIPAADRTRSFHPKPVARTFMDGVKLRRLARGKSARGIPPWMRRSEGNAGQAVAQV